MAAGEKLPRKVYERELFRLQAETVKLQEWVRQVGGRLVVIFEGRDAAGKGSAIKRLTQYLNPRVARIVALPAPTDRQKTRWYFQRYIEHLPSAGEIVVFDRSWYNRTGVERVMGYCTLDEYRRFLHQCPIFERLLVEDGIMLRKYWFSVSAAEQERRFHGRLDDPMRRWKLSTLDLESMSRWDDYSRAKDEMLVHTDIPEPPGTSWRATTSGAAASTCWPTCSRPCPTRKWSRRRSNSRPGPGRPATNGRTGRPSTTCPTTPRP